MVIDKNVVEKVQNTGKKTNRACGLDSAWTLSVKLLGQPILLPNESRKAYRRLFESFADDLQPRDAVEVMMVRDLTDLAFDVLRQQKVKMLLMMPSRKLIPHMLKKHVSPEPPDEEYAEMSAARIKDLALLDHMIGMAQQRKYYLLDFLYRLRAIRTKAAKKSDELPVIDTEFTELAPTNDAPALMIK
jgi:hypothetical protein